MKSTSYLAVFLLTGALAGPAAAGDLLTRILHDCGLCPSPCGCPDDYCRKPCPRVPHLAPCRGPDDYCRKPFPCLWCPARACLPDDYCPKPCPVPGCLHYPAWYSCGLHSPGPAGISPAPAPGAPPSAPSHGSAVVPASAVRPPAAPSAVVPAHTDWTPWGWEPLPPSAPLDPRGGK